MAKISTKKINTKRKGKTDVIKLNKNEEMKLVLKRIVSGNRGPQFIVENEEGKEFFLPSHKGLMSILCNLGQEINITLTQEGKGSTKNGTEFNAIPFEYEIEFKE